MPYKNAPFHDIIAEKVSRDVFTVLTQNKVDFKATWVYPQIPRRYSKPSTCMQCWRNQVKWLGGWMSSESVTNTSQVRHVRSFLVTESVVGPCTRIMGLCKRRRWWVCWGSTGVRSISPNGEWEKEWKTPFAALQGPVLVWKRLSSLMAGSSAAYTYTHSIRKFSDPEAQSGSNHRLKTTPKRLSNKETYSRFCTYSRL